MRRRTVVLLIAVFAAFGVAAVAFAMRGNARTGVAVIGDRAPEILEATGWRQALPLRTAALTVVSLDNWARLPFIGDMAALCGSRCADETGLVRIVGLSPGGTRKIVLIRLDALPEAAQDGDGNPLPDFACVAAVLSAERQALTGPDDPPACAGDMTAERTRWALPFGLGTI